LNEALRAYRDKLAQNVEDYEKSLAAMQNGSEQTYEVDRSTGERTDLTPQRIADYTDIIDTLRALIRDLDIKLG